MRLRTAAAKRYKKVENATAVSWKTLLIAERTFRRLDAPELLAEVAEEVPYVNGEWVKPSQSTAEKKAAARAPYAPWTRPLQVVCKTLHTNTERRPAHSGV